MGSVDRSIFEQVQRCAYLHVNLDSLIHNVNVLRSSCENTAIGVIGVVKAGAYGHGSVLTSRHLKANGVERLAVATISEALHLRNHDITGPIHVFGNVQDFHMDTCVKFGFIPTVSTKDSVAGMYKAMNKESNSDAMAKYQTNVKPGCIHIKIDTGMSRNGCQPEELEEIWKYCNKLEVPVEGMFTHFADSWGDPPFTQTQLDTFNRAIAPYQGIGIKFHVANSGAVLNGVGTNFDFIRPGIALYGLPPDDNDERFQNFGLLPIGSIIMQPALVKKLQPGTKIGYGSTYEVTAEEGEWIATFAIGYADGVWRLLSSKPEAEFNGYAKSSKTGAVCPIVGRVSMDAITVRLPDHPSMGEVYYLISASHCPHTSAPAIARRVSSISYEVMTRQSARLPRVYESTPPPGINNGQPILKIVRACTQAAY